MQNCETELAASLERERWWKSLLVLSTAGSALAAAAMLLRRTTRARDDEPREPPKPATELGRWFRVEDRFFVDEPFVELARSRLGASETSSRHIDLVLPSQGLLRLERISYAREFPKQTGALYEVVQAPARLLDLLRQLELFGVLKRGGDFLNFPRVEDPDADL